jgi:DNA-binding beta-propeller fold protein YncE
MAHEPALEQTEVWTLIVWKLVALGLVLGALAGVAAPSASADVAHMRSMPVSSPVFALDGSDDILVARTGAIDRYSSLGTPETGFSTSADFTDSDDVAFSGARVYAISPSPSRLWTWLPDGTDELVTPSDSSFSANLNVARGLDVRGSRAYVATAETNRVTLIDVTPTFGLNVLVAGVGVSSGMDGGFETCAPAPTCQSGWTGTTLAHLNNPRDIALDQSLNAYVAESGIGSASGPSRIKVLDATPAPVAAIGGFGSGAGELNNPNGVVLDAGEENVYVADTSNQRVMQFEVDGTFVQGFGYGVDTGAARFETCTTASTCQAGILGSAPGQLSSPLKIDFDSTGDLYVSSSGARIDVFDLDAPGPMDKSALLKAQPRRVTKGKIATLTATLAPCPDTADEPISFERKSRGQWAPVGDPAAADNQCKASMNRTITRRTKFRATSEATATFAEAISVAQTVRVLSPRLRAGRARRTVAASLRRHDFADQVVGNLKQRCRRRSRSMFSCRFSSAFPGFSLSGRGSVELKRRVSYRFRVHAQGRTLTLTDENEGRFPG